MTEKTCGDCIYGRGEECDGPGGSREGHEIYSDTPACDCYEEDAPLADGFWSEDGLGAVMSDMAVI